MGKRDVADFNKRVCSGAHPDAEGPCQHRVRTDEDTGNRGVDQLARLEGAALEAVTGNKQFKCGMCGCPLANLEVSDKAPENCPRMDLHNGPD